LVILGSLFLVAPIASIVATVTGFRGGTPKVSEKIINFYSLILNIEIVPVIILAIVAGWIALFGK
ncbi:MAG: hypothetical protein ACREC6_06040, partial [Hyphomicrobiaceae bacterium]